MKARNRMPRFAYFGSIGLALVSAVVVPFWLFRRSREERGLLPRRKGGYLNRRGALRRGHLFH